MFWIILTILLAISAIVVWFGPRRHTATQSDHDFVTREVTSTTTQPYRKAATLAVVGIGVVWLLISVPFMIKPVSAGNVGVIRQFGGIVGQASEGVTVIAPWQSLERHSVQTRRHSFEGITAASAETQDVFMSATINYSISERDVQGLIRNVGSNWFETLIPARVNQYVKQETARWPTIEIIPNREVIRQNVLRRLQDDLGSNYSINVSDFLIDNISFSPAFLAAIEEKQVATEQAQAAQNRTEVVAAEAEQARVRAQGQADAAVISAQGEAEANALVDASLTPAVLQWLAITNLADDITIALIPSGEGIILDPATLLAGASS